MHKLISIAMMTAILVACASAPVLDSPRQVQVPAVADQAEVEDAVLWAMRNRGWAVHEREPGHIVADLNIRSHFARVDIRYDDDLVTIEYVDSRNLDYSRDGGVEHIHGNFNSWMTNLADDIRRQLSYVE